MSENREQVIATIEDSIRYTNVSLRQISQVLVNCDEQFQAAILSAKADKWGSVEFYAFASVLESVATIMISHSVNGADEDILDRIRRAGSKSITK